MLTARSADVHAGVPDAEPDPAAPVGAADDAALLAAVLALEVPDADVDGADEAAVDVDDAAHPAASTPTATSGMASSAFFMRSPDT
jgi:hypothetical protein